MENFVFINYHQTRDFSRKMNATFEFIKQNFAGLFKSIFFIAGPPIVIASLFMGSFMNSFMAISMGSKGRESIEAFQKMFTTPTFWAEMFLMMAFVILSSVVSVATIYNYLLLYEQKKSNKIEVREVWEKVRSTIGMYLGTTILYYTLMMATAIVIGVPVAMTAAISPVLVFFAFVAYFAFLIYLFISCSLIFIVRAYENKGFFEAMSRSFYLVRGKWWSTFGLITVLYIIVTTASYIFMIPYYVMVFINTLHSIENGSFQEPSSTSQITTLIFLTLYYLTQMVLYALPTIGIAFQYFNMVERKEARGLMTQIEGLGQQNHAEPTREEHY